MKSIWKFINDNIIIFVLFLVTFILHYLNSMFSSKFISDLLDDQSLTIMGTILAINTGSAVNIVIRLEDMKKNNNVFKNLDIDAIKTEINHNLVFCLISFLIMIMINRPVAKV